MTKYRIVPGITGFGWVTVEKWNDALGRYVPQTSFRSLDEAKEFIGEE